MANKWKTDFPILKRTINDKPLVYLDNAATSQVPKSVIDAYVNFETKHRANVHRGIHTLSEESTALYEQSRAKIGSFINAVVPEEVIFTKNATESMNLIAYSWGKYNLKNGDIVLISEAEHHSNNTPWLELKEEIGIEVKYIPVNKKGKIDIKNIHIDWRLVKLVSISHVSNVLGGLNDIKEIKKYISKRVAECNSEVPLIAVDGAQSIPHMPINVQKLGCDFFAFSGHKMCGPMGIGVLWINRELFTQLNPFISGGGMIDTVGYDNYQPAKMPEMLEAGTPNVGGVVGLASALEYLDGIGMEKIYQHDQKLMEYTLDKMSKYEGIEIYGSNEYEDRCGVISFNIDGIDSHDLAKILDVQGIAIRSGHHCNMPWHKKNNIKSSARLSIYLYNDEDDIEQLIKGFDKAKDILLKN